MLEVYHSCKILQINEIYEYGLGKIFSKQFTIAFQVSSPAVILISKKGVIVLPE